MYVVAHYDNKVPGQSRSIVPRFPGSGILVPCGHGWIFVAAQVWHEMSQTLVPGHSLNSWHGRDSWGLFHLGHWCCRCSGGGLCVLCQVGPMQVVVLRSSVWLEPVGGSCATWDSVDCFDTALTKVSPHVVVCGTIAGAYLIAVPW